MASICSASTPDRVGLRSSSAVSGRAAAMRAIAASGCVAREATEQIADGAGAVQAGRAMHDHPARGVPDCEQCRQAREALAVGGQLHASARERQVDEVQPVGSAQLGDPRLHLVGALQREHVRRPARGPAGQARA
jgi:hypothetical protein